VQVAPAVHRWLSAVHELAIKLTNLHASSANSGHNPWKIWLFQNFAEFPEIAAEACCPIIRLTQCPVRDFCARRRCVAGLIAPRRCVEPDGLVALADYRALLTSLRRKPRKGFRRRRHATSGGGTGGSILIALNLEIGVSNGGLLDCLRVFDFGGYAHVLQFNIHGRSRLGKPERQRAWPPSL